MSTIDILDVNAGTRIEIELLDSLGNNSHCSYISQLIEIKDSENITVAVPIEESKLILLPFESAVRCLFIHPKHGLIAFSGIVTDRLNSGNIASMNINIRSKLIRVQRREHYRLEITTKATYFLLTDDINNDNCTKINTNFKKGYTKNISGNGANLITNEPIEKGRNIILNLILEPDLEISFKCTVVRCLRLDGVTPSKHNIALTFIDISKKNQDILVKFIFNKQKLLIKNKKG